MEPCFLRIIFCFRLQRIEPLKDAAVCASIVGVWLRLQAAPGRIQTSCALSLVRNVISLMAIGILASPPCSHCAAGSAEFLLRAHCVLHNSMVQRSRSDLCVAIESVSASIACSGASKSTPIALPLIAPAKSRNSFS